MRLDVLARFFGVLAWPKVKVAYGHLLYTFKFRYRMRSFAFLYGLRLRKISGRGGLTSAEAIVGVIPYYGNASVLPSFLDHYRGLGLDFFVFLDLSCGIPLADVLGHREDVAIWRPPANLHLRATIHWLNFLRRKYASGRWCLSVEPTEFFVFPHCETRHIRDLLQFLENEGRDHLYALALDTYGDGPTQSLQDPPAAPLDALPYFDAVGYHFQSGGRFSAVTVKGGLQRRTLFKKEPVRSPPLNRVPLVKWRRKFTYVTGTRLITPRHLNTPHSRWHLSTTGCLLRCALLDDDESMTTACRVESATLPPDKATPNYPGLLVLREQNLTYAGSARYRTSQDLVDWGLMVPGQWF